MPAALEKLQLQLLQGGLYWPRIQTYVLSSTCTYCKCGCNELARTHRRLLAGLACQ